MTYFAKSREIFAEFLSSHAVQVEINGAEMDKKEFTFSTYFEMTTSILPSL